MRNLVPLLLVAFALTACQPANDKADTGEAIARGAGVGDGPTGRPGAPVARGAEKGPIPANIDEGVEPQLAPDNLAEPSNNMVEEPANVVDPALPIDPPR
jgi:hypothetical protein